MGYTHYYHVKGTIEQSLWDAFIVDCKKAVKKLPKTIDDEPLALTGCYAYKNAVFNKDKIYFNGGDDKPREKNPSGGWVNDEFSHETFMLLRVNKEQGQYFCKTARKPYDLMVMITLLLAKYHFKDAISFDSDGDWDKEWVTGKEFIAQHFPQIAMELFVDGKSLLE